MGMLVGGFNSQVIKFTVALGADMAESDTDTTPFDSRAGFRLKYNSGIDGIIQNGNSPAGGGAIVTWSEDRIPITPPGFICDDFEYKWELFQDDGADTLVSPVAVSTFETWNADKIWFAQQTTGPTAVQHWIIDITIREIANTGNADTIRMDMDVETS